jgi:uncharacterized membrane protein YoaK (UPF0700 family)
MGFVAGFVDTCGFIALFGLFTAHVTGNFVLIGAALVEQAPGLVTKLLALPVFMATVALAHLAITRGAMAPSGRKRAVLVAQALFLVAFMALGVAATPVEDPDHLLPALAGLSGVVAMAIQNAAARSVFAALAPTTVMTGNVTQVLMDLVDLLKGGDGVTAARGRLGKMVPVVLAFTVGAGGGALGVWQVGFWCLGLPIVLLLGLAAAARGAS